MLSNVLCVAFGVASEFSHVPSSDTDPLFLQPCDRRQEEDLSRRSIFFQGVLQSELIPPILSIC